MLSIARRTAAGAAILLIMPLAVWVSGWMWQPGHNTLWLKTLYWITDGIINNMAAPAAVRLAIESMSSPFSLSVTIITEIHPTGGYVGSCV